MTLHLGDTQALSRLLCKVLKDAKNLRQLTLAGDFSVIESQKRKFSITHKKLERIRLSHKGLCKDKVTEI